MNGLQSKSVLSLAGVEWQAAWERYQAKKERPSGAGHWTARSGSYASGPHQDDYEREFIKRSGIVAGETVLDFGCGVGLLAVPLAQMGCKVLACDFSQGMLDCLAERAQAAGVSDMIEPMLVSWDDDWDRFGLVPGIVDVAIASRSIATANLLGALKKLDAAARRRVCVTVAAGSSPRRDDRAYEAVGREKPYVEDHAYCMNVLLQHGVFPDLSYITTSSRPGFASREAAVVALSQMMGDNLNGEEKRQLEAFLDEQYKIDETAHPDRMFSSISMRDVRWAFISW